ncbi:hypothetical protein ACIPF8_14635 [Collimonas sp. NPDC087041]|uniref:hypothetical protein n=1 Tax=Collimonas sp. NPDC087041 TaxID=3363960 RepID=UPI00382461FD
MPAFGTRKRLRVLMIASDPAKKKIQKGRFFVAWHSGKEDHVALHRGKSTAGQRQMHVRQAHCRQVFYDASLQLLQLGFGTQN